MAMTATRDAGSREIEKAPSGSGWYTASETWTVHGVTSSDTRVDVVNCSDLPNIGTSYDGMVCSSRRARETDKSSTWKVEVHYKSTVPGLPSPSGYWTTELPSERPINKQWNTIHYDKAVEKDLNGDPIVNSAGDPFDPPLVEDFPRIGLVVTRSETDFDPQIIKYYSNKISTDSFLGFLPGEARCVEINADPYYENGESGHTVRYVFEFDCQTYAPAGGRWVHELLDAGGRYLDDYNVLQVATDDEGVKHGGVILLDGMGKKLPSDGSEPAQYKNYETKDKVAFGPLNIT